ncbi:hypothetical protein FWK35_00011089 [Aphis craccivora]|uniref:Uncharacterized protein n=1 Tax=Aphis craccivora TaxID=307492 RepID=A0A6G0YTA9_APHCR|nr:hypothetical protein FWK35_00011089 [Aphis craccivora]
MILRVFSIEIDLVENCRFCVKIPVFP